MSTSCQDIEGLITASALGELSEPETKELARHLESCPQCAQAYRDAFLALEALRNWPQPSIPSGLGERTLTALASERARPPSLGLRVRQFFDRQQNQPVTPLKGVLAAACGLMLFFGLMSIEPRSPRAAASRQSCEVNLKAIEQAVERFRADHQGRPPSELSELIPRYLYSVPNCPHAGYETYSQGYKVVQEDSKHSFEITCSVEHQEK